jgi:NAD(P)-dependent dehydrogenase (short-subunit alcohol dehydrogenase family)
MLTAPFMLTRAFASAMRDQHYGRIISIASLQSYQAFGDSLPYASAKSGVLGLTRALAEAYSNSPDYQNITANALAPGYVATDLTKSVFADAPRANRLADRTMVGRNSVPQDLVGPCVFLASPASAYVTGQCLPVDGGFTALGLR